MSVGEGLTNLAKIANDYINGGMKQKGAYEAVRNARTRESNRAQDSARQPDTTHAVAQREDVPRAIDNDPGVQGDNTLNPGGPQSA